MSYSISSCKYFSLLYWFIISTNVFGNDIPNSKDHPLVTRYQGSTISAYKQIAYDNYILPISKLTKQKYKVQESLSLEGKITRITYTLPHNRSSLEVFKNYQNELLSNNFKVIFECNSTTCGSSYDWSNQVLSRGSRLAGKNTSQRFLAAKLSQSDGDIYLALYIVRRSTKQLVAQVDVLEQAPLQTGMVEVNLDYLKEELERNGKVTLYSLYFDLNKATLKPESTPTLQNIALLLKQTPNQKFYVVGHTDTTGSLDYNISLSQRRAETVVNTLVNQFSSSNHQLQAHGVGPLAPLASNFHEKSRKINRRVELVLQ
ncbi:OmpA family protein [Spartinivicinus poritis]|uniref:DUF4892 domain-containing protein n=1 Tax=Spartinivicinus poritis TaxID=2994640 RepID=A0ABT5UD32_9GAMM|nr:OmpA family protein [Spartinivicinus sp. A2-2]MDE1464237.1 DUF4892 domain-containing protein [Spartinivicinus sp. A2-2]